MPQDIECSTSGRCQNFREPLPLAYEELRKLAVSEKGRQIQEQTLQTTALANEAGIKPSKK